MPRPDITVEELAEWTASYEEFSKNGIDLLRPTRLEVWLGGCYLKGKLMEMGCPEKRADRICFAVGQRQSMPKNDTDEDWVPVYKAIEDYKQGKWEEPGEELGLRIFAEKFGPNPNSKDVLNWYRSVGINEGKLKALMFKMLMEGKSALPLPPPPE